MDRFIGTWQLVSSENFDEFMKAFGVSDELRKVAHVIEPKLTISQKGDTVIFDVDGVVTSQKLSFKLGEAFHTKTMDGRDCKMTVNVDGESIVELAKWDHSESCSVYQIKGGQMIKTMTYQDIETVRVFDKI